jgi:hypothetical protein
MRGNTALCPLSVRLRPMFTNERGGSCPETARKRKRDMYIGIGTVVVIVIIVVIVLALRR